MSGVERVLRCRAGSDLFDGNVGTHYYQKMTSDLREKNCQYSLEEADKETCFANGIIAIPLFVTAALMHANCNHGGIGKGGRQ